VHNSDDLLDADAVEANRREVKRTIVITAVALAFVLVASVFVVIGGITG